MNICTISTGGEWLDWHTARWVRFVRASNPGAELGLILIGDEGLKQHSVVRMFDKVAWFGPEYEHRTWYNELRMSACEFFGWEK